jgi:hypothetical protein
MHLTGKLTEDSAPREGFEAIHDRDLLSRDGALRFTLEIRSKADRPSGGRGGNHELADGFEDGDDRIVVGLTSYWISHAMGLVALSTAWQVQVSI